jgi:SAM-dependent methyltransferase
MSDIVQNRKHIEFGEKLSMAWMALRENGLPWCVAFAAYYTTSSLADRSFGAMHWLRSKYKLPGLNGRGLNKAIWQSWDWSAGGDEWTLSEEWKESLIEKILKPRMAGRESVVEIGPGGGRWTGHLIEAAKTYKGIDISETCVEVCRDKFKSANNASFEVGSGCDLKALDDASVDAIWSFDVFVHINAEEVEQYAREFNRVLKPGGIGVIHHGTIGGEKGGWRSNLTTSQFKGFLEDNKLAAVDSFSEWSDGDTSYPVGLYEDAVTVFEKKVVA